LIGGRQPNADSIAGRGEGHAFNALIFVQPAQ